MSEFLSNFHFIRPFVLLLLLLPPVGSGIALSAAALGPRDLLSCASLAASSVSSSRRTRS